MKDLCPGHAVVMRFGGIRRIKWLGRHHYAPAFLAHNPEKWPVRIQTGALAEGVLARDLYVSPGHSMLLGDVRNRKSDISIHGRCGPRGQRSESGKESRLLSATFAAPSAMLIKFGLR